MPKPPAHLKIHFQTKEGRPFCSNHVATLTTTNLQEVTCSTCFTQLVNKPTRDAQQAEKQRRKVEEIHNIKVAFLQRDIENKKLTKSF